MANILFDAYIIEGSVYDDGTQRFDVATQKVVGTNVVAVPLAGGYILAVRGANQPEPTIEFFWRKVAMTLPWPEDSDGGTPPQDPESGTRSMLLPVAIAVAVGAVAGRLTAKS